MTNSTEHRQQTEPMPPSRAGQEHSPGLAALCAVIPGIGAVYNRQYLKALVHFSVFAGLCILADDVVIFGLGAFSFYVFTIIDAYRSAQDIQRRMREHPESLQEQPEQANAPIWGGILVLLGVLFLVDNFVSIRFDFLVKFWPLLFIFLGLYLIYDYYQRRQAAPRARTTSQAPLGATGSQVAEEEERSS